MARPSVLTSLLVLGLLAGCGGYAGDPPADATGEAGEPSVVPTPTPTPVVDATEEPDPSGGPELICTLVGGVSMLTITADVGLVDDLSRMTVTLRQGTTTRSTTFPVGKPVAGQVVRRARGVLQDDVRFRITLASDMGGGAWAYRWDPEQKATVVAEASTKVGLGRYRAEDTFTFVSTYPNGKACDKEPYLSHETLLGEGDRVG